MTKKLLDPTVDFDKPDQDIFDAIDWFEQTGEDRGLPASYKKKVNASRAARGLPPRFP